MFRLFALFCSFLGLVAGEARAATYQPLKTHENYCLDHTGGSMINGTKPQIWTCNGGKNQNWQLKADGHLKSAAGLCLDLKDGQRKNAAAVQMWTCADNNANQLWEWAGNALRLKGTNLCLDVVDGGFWDGARLQVWQCAQNASSSNQLFAFSQSQAAPAAASGDTWFDHPMVSIDKFVQLHPECAPGKDAFVAAAADQGLHPTFLAAICSIESTCGVGLVGSSSAWGGYFQFTDDSAWREFGNGGDRNNIWDAAYAAARYFRSLLNSNGNDMDAAMRSYNGEIQNGGAADYQWRAWTFCAGNSPY